MPSREEPRFLTSMLTGFAVGAILLMPGCAGMGAPSISLFGAFFPAWILCGIIGIGAAIVGRVLMVATGMTRIIPYQFAVCTALAVIVAIVTWLAWFGL